MTPEIARLAHAARRAASSGNWAEVKHCANRILKHDSASAEGHFLAGLAQLAGGHGEQAEKAFARALRSDPGRYDAGVELALLYAGSLRFARAAELLRRIVPLIEDSPLYLDRAGSAWSRLGLHDDAWPLFARANELQPGVPALQANLAACAVYTGRIDEARELYENLLESAPEHQRTHFQLSRIVRASDARHVEQMQAVLESNGEPPERNIFLYYALGKELEDLERWDEAFDYYRRAGDAAAAGAAAAGYRVEADLELIDAIIETCSADWLAASGAGNDGVDEATDKTPVFVVGLPRTGTTLTDRILSAHSSVDSVDETHFLELAIQELAGVPARQTMSPATVRAAAGRDVSLIARSYRRLVDYRLGDAPFFVEKLPENFLYLGFAARAWPDARLVCMRRHPMDACFAMYKQSFFRYAYSLDDLARYYLAHERLFEHWRNVLGERLIEVQYETLVTEQESETRRLLERVGLEFEESCLAFEKNLKATATASAAQVREKMHSRSIGKWRRFERHLEPLRSRLESAGINVL